MVAKSIRPVLIGLFVVLSACQTMTPVSESDALTRNNQPEEVVVPETDTGAEITSNENRPKAPEPKPAKKANEINIVAEPEPDPQQVVTQLQMEALQLQSEGRWSEAELKLERALRINAEKVDIYHQLATVRMGQKRFAEAEQIALKGLTLTDQSPKYKSSMWEVIAQCRSAMGDIKGAKKARQEMLHWMDDEDK